MATMRDAMAKALDALVEVLARKVVSATATLPTDPREAYVLGFKAGFKASMEAQKAINDPTHPINAKD